MQQNGCDTAALQRFNPNSSEGPTRDAMAAKVASAAVAYGRKFYVMYDVSGWTSMQTEIMTDWTSKMSAYTASSAYAKQNGKPVLDAGNGNVALRARANNMIVTADNAGASALIANRTAIGTWEQFTRISDN